MMKKLLIQLSVIFCVCTLMVACGEQKAVELDKSAKQQPLTVENTEDVSVIKQTELKAPPKLISYDEAINPYNSLADIEGYKTTEWLDLLPEDDLEALLNPPAYLDEISDGTIEDQLDNKLLNIKKSAPEDSYQQALVSTSIIEAVNGELIRIPGFVVPLEVNKNEVITSFFLVPFFGACIHAPPPPPNQIIYVEVKQGIVMQSLYDAVWVSGKLSTSLIENEMATAAYSMKMGSIEIYDQRY